MMFRDNLLYVVINMFLIYAGIRFLDVFLDKSKKDLKLFILTGIIYWIINSICFIFYRRPEVSLLSTILGLFAVATCAYKDTMWKKLLAVFSTLTISVTIEEVMVLITNYNQDSRPYLVNILTILFLFLVQIIIEKVWNFKEESSLPKKYYNYMLLSSFFSVIIIFF